MSASQHKQAKAWCGYLTVKSVESASDYTKIEVIAEVCIGTVGGVRAIETENIRSAIESAISQYCHMRTEAEREVTR